jgi:hypothetical protein
LRSSQGDGGATQILTTPPGYQLRVDPQQIDVHLACTLMDKAAGVEGERRAELLADAYALWKGRPLAGVPECLTAPELEELRLAVHGTRVDADLAIGRHTGLSPIVRVNPLPERTTGQLMRALYYAGPPRRRARSCTNGCLAKWSTPWASIRALSCAACTEGCSTTSFRR